jgi:hypothetical protein
MASSLTTRFLRLFSAFRVLEQDRDASMANVCDSLQMESTRASMLEDRLTSALEDRNRLWDLVQESLRGERTAYQAGLNLQWQQRGYGAPYPDAPQLPQSRVPQDVPNSIVPRPMTGSERMAAGTREFIKQYAEQLNSAGK